MAESEPSWPYFPIFLKLAGEPVLVVGGGEVALRKVRLLLRAEARVRLVARELHPDLAALGLRADAAAFAPALLDGCRLAIAATDDAALNARVAAAAREAGYLAACTLTGAHVDDEPHLRPRLGMTSADTGPRLRAKVSPLGVALRRSGAARTVRRLRRRRDWIPAAGPAE